MLFLLFLKYYLGNNRTLSWFLSLVTSSILLGIDALPSVYLHSWVASGIAKRRFAPRNAGAIVGHRVGALLILSTKRGGGGAHLPLKVEIPFGGSVSLVCFSKEIFGCGLVVVVVVVLSLKANHSLSEEQPDHYLQFAILHRVSK